MTTTLRWKFKWINENFPNSTKFPAFINHAISPTIRITISLKKFEKTNMEAEFPRYPCSCFPPLPNKAIKLANWMFPILFIALSPFQTAVSEEDCMIDVEFVALNESLISTPVGCIGETLVTRWCTSCTIQMTARCWLRMIGSDLLMSATVVFQLLGVWSFSCLVALCHILFRVRTALVLILTGMARWLFDVLLVSAWFLYSAVCCCSSRRSHVLIQSGLRQNTEQLTQRNCEKRHDVTSELLSHASRIGTSHPLRRTKNTVRKF